MKNKKVSSPPRPGLRERKKEQTRKAIAETAKAMFAERGFDNVTVAEVADGANVSVKTLFTYFGSKEDLVFESENSHRDEILACVRGRAPGESALDAIGRFFEARISSSGQRSVLAGLDGFRRTVGDSPTLHSRLRLMWERYEEALAALLAEETGAPAHDPRPRTVAAQLMAIYRLLASEAVRDYVRSHRPEEQRAALKNWLNMSLALVGNGVRDYARRPEP